ncbi:uncharacterized protein LOC126188331 [Schistocerca cancellata]|uniref:uncharacterized protein LOC126188331 n=1 Tax=Schistocerca cancellata TaxID=274614 RepID=UPI002118F76C|nr:uncharacterized protein LOC126188331 [Schistocerca cancellata]
MSVCGTAIFDPHLQQQLVSITYKTNAKDLHLYESVKKTTTFLAEACLNIFFPPVPLGIQLSAIVELKLLHHIGVPYIIAKIAPVLDDNGWNMAETITVDFGDKGNEVDVYLENTAIVMVDQCGQMFAARA